MILEVTKLDIRPGQEREFVAAFKQAQNILMRAKGYIDHQLQKCLEIENRYIMLINWETLENHTVDFKQAPEYQEWRALLHHFYEPPPKAEHYAGVFSGKR